MKATDTAVYVTNRHGTRHLSTIERVATLPQPTTLCGITIRWSLWEEGDETAGGSRATCRSCRRVLASKPDHP